MLIAFWPLSTVMITSGWAHPFMQTGGCPARNMCQGEFVYVNADERLDTGAGCRTWRPRDRL
jgi:hypothetical protein